MRGVRLSAGPDEPEEAPDVTQLLISQAGAGRAKLLPGAVVNLVTPAPRDIWRGVLADDPGATALQTPEYFEAVLAETGGTDVSRFYQLRDGRQLVLPLVRRRAALGPTVDAGYPHGYGSGGMLATGGLLADDVRTVVPDLGGQSLSVRIGGAHHTSEQWAAGLGPGVVDQARRVHVVDLSPYVGGTLTAFRHRHLAPAVRQELQRSRQLGVEVETDATGRLLPTFLDLYRAWADRSAEGSRRSAPLARRRTAHREPHRFAAAAARTGPSCRVHVAWHRGRPVAASITVIHGEHATAGGTYSIEELAAPVGAHRLTQVTAIEDALAAGCRHLDLGQVGAAPGPADVEDALGATPRTVIDLRIEGPGLTRLRTARLRAEAVLVRARTRPAADPEA
jgi:hypothetical protein